MRIHLLGLLAATGCSGLVDDGGTGGLTDKQIKAKSLWLAKALPSLRANCISCHATGQGGSQPAPTFIAGGGDLEIRDNLLAFDPPEVNLDAPPTSKLLTRGAHDGPSLSAGDASDILEWIKAEKDAGSTTGPVTPPLAVAKFQPSVCAVGESPTVPPAAPNPNCLVNSVALDSVGAPGATVEFVFQPLAPGSYMFDMKVNPGTGGVFLEHPQFVTWPATPPEPDTRPDCIDDASLGTYCPDEIDRFQTLVLDVMGGAAPVPIPPGTQTFDKFLATDMMTIQFKTVSPFK